MHLSPSVQRVHPSDASACTHRDRATAHSLSLRATHSFTSRVHVFCRVCLTGGIKSHYSTVVTLLTEFSFLLFFLLLLLLLLLLFFFFPRHSSSPSNATRRVLIELHARRSPLSKDFAGMGEDFRRCKPFRAVLSGCRCRGYNVEAGRR